MPRAQHPKAVSFIHQKLLSGVTVFEELESRIAALPSDKEKGDAFEVFAEAYLATQRKHDADKVWPLAAATNQLLDRLGLTAQDYGVDGIFQTRFGEYNAYQVKFRSNRPTLTWRELSTFMGLADSPHFVNRVLFTNCDDLPPVLNERRNFFCIRGSDLDRLEVDDFRAIEAWLEDGAFVTPKKQPKPHQIEALAALLPALEAHDRVSAIMACGTGKTLVALWVAEKRQASRILVLVPSLALLRQTLHEWLHESSLSSLAYLCVCSDPTVKDGLDSISTSQSDLDFHVSTEAASVRAFLDAPFNGTKVVFSTYQSARVVGAALKSDEAFDLAVFDEAHKTAGREGRNFAFALEETNLPIRKRLFLTATPRHYNPHQQDNEGDAQIVFSMDRPNVYGPQAFRLTFAEAASRNIICGYKVIVSVITSEMVTNELLSRGEVLVNGDAVKARQVANQIALRDSIEKYGANKIFTFHKTVKSAASFVSEGSEGVCTHLKDFETFHVNGMMPTARREREMHGFRSAVRAVMSNARCLTEGVDVPAVDMVAFLSPRRSRVDIVQATGRAMRQSPGKTLGYVLVPLYVELAADETVEKAVARAEFDEVWDVLQSLQEQDDILADLIRNVGEQKGRGKGFDDSGFADRIDFGGPRLGLEDLRAAVTTRCLDTLYSTWDIWLGKLNGFKERFGHCNVETGWEEDPALASWVSAQRTRRNKGLLQPERIRRLDELGFVWDYQAQQVQETWMKWYRELVIYTKENGNPHIPRTHANTKLASWVWIQRLRREKNYGKAPKLTEEQVALLDKLGFRWDVREEKWIENFEKLKQFKEIHGHCRVELIVDENDKLLGWVNLQRSLKARRTINAERKAQLDALGFSWVREATDHKWDEMYERLKKYMTTHGSTDVPHRWKDDRKLAAWVSQQRQRRKKGIITAEQVRLLDELGFTWQHRERGTWEDRLAEVAAFKEKHGHCAIPVGRKSKLGGFVNHMRTLRNRGILSAERISMLDELGFIWSPSSLAKLSKTSWDDKYEELIRYKDQYGNCKVPINWPVNSGLGHWVGTQRSRNKAGKLSPKRKLLLDSIGFDWGYTIDLDGIKPKDLWQTRYRQLVAFKKDYGHLNVPTNDPSKRQLSIWVYKQRQQKRCGALTQERTTLLDDIGFNWESEIILSVTGKWKTNYDELLIFQRQYGHCNVPRSWAQHPQLYGWIRRQRYRKHNGSLSPDRESLLNSIGFDWGSTRESAGTIEQTWHRRYNQLVDYKIKTGHCKVPSSWPENPQLGGWVSRQRHQRKIGKLPPNRETILNTIGFIWECDQEK